MAISGASLTERHVAKHRAWEENAATGFGFSAADVALNQRLTATDLGPGQKGMIENVQNASAENDYLQKLEEQNKKRRIAYGIATIQGQAISQEIFNDISNYVDNKIEEFGRDIEANRIAQEAEREKIVAQESSVASADTDRHVATMRLKHAADRESMVQYNQSELDAKSIATAESRVEASAAGDIADMRRLAEQAAAEQAERERLAREAEEARIAREKAQARYDETVETFAQRFEKLQELKDNLAKLEGEGADLQGRLQEYEDFREFYSSDAIQEKLRNGTLTLEELKAGGMPADMAARLEGQDLNPETIGKALGTGYGELISDTRSTFRDKGMTYASQYDDKGIRSEETSISDRFYAAAKGFVAERFGWQEAPNQEVRIASNQVPSGPAATL